MKAKCSIYKKGFTLVELLVVISIIALLLSILMPSLNIARQKAKGVLCVANQKELCMAWRMYAFDNDDYMPSANTSFGGKSLSPNPTLSYCWVQWPTLEDGRLQNDLTNATLEDKLRGIRAGTLFKYVENIDLYHCPGDRRTVNNNQTAFRSYSIVAGMNGAHPDGQFFIEPFQKIINIKRPSENYVFVEESDPRGFNINAWVIYPKDSPREGWWWDPLAIWHHDSGTLGFADGHAILKKWKERSTVEMAERQLINYPAPDSRDIEYMMNHYPYKALYGSRN